MTNPAIDVRIVNDTTLERCPLCGDVLDLDSPHALCPECQEDEDEKWADYVAEQEQAWHPY